MRIRPVLTLVLAAAALAPASAGAATLAGSDALIPGTAGATGVSAYGGDLAWSRLDADRRYHLVTDIAGVIAEPPVASAPAPFDVDLGNEGNGAVIAVYPRCDPGCNIKALAIDASTGERSALKVNTSACDEVAPSTDNGVLAFVRRGSRCPHPGLYVRSGAHVRLLSTQVSRSSQIPARTDCTATRVVYDYRPRASGGDSYIRQVTIKTGKAKTFAHGSVSDAGGDVLTAPVVDATTTYWLDSDPIDETASVMRLKAGAFALPVVPTSASVASGVVYYTASDGLHRFTPSA